MTRQQVIISIAIINRLSKQIRTLISTNTLTDAEVDLPEILKVKRYGSGIETYFKRESCEPFISDIDNICSTDKLWGYINSNPDQSKESLDHLISFATVVEMLKSYSEVYKRICKEAKFKNLIDELSTDKALEVMQRAVDAGLLTSTFLPDASLSRLQVRILAFALAKIIGLPRKGQYSIFMKQWNLNNNDRLGWVYMPEKEHEELNIIKKVFPEVDYMELTKPKVTAFFRIECDDSKILALFMSLLTHGYIDPKTTYDNFKKVFGRGDLTNRKPVNWIKTQRLLSYFIFIAFDNSMYNIWQKAKNCFVVNGKTPNLGALRSGLNKIERESLNESYDPILYGIAKLFSTEFKSVGTVAKKSQET